MGPAVSRAKETYSLIDGVPITDNGDHECEKSKPVMGIMSSSDGSYTGQLSNLFMAVD